MSKQPDRIEKEIEEILAKLDVGDEKDPSQKEREPIPFDKRRRAKQPGFLSRLTGSISLPALPLTPATLLFTGAGTMVAGLILASFWDPFIWLSFAGIVLFMIAFGWSFKRRSAPGGGGARGPRQVYWRDRVIEYEPAEPGPLERFKRIFRRR
jgi:hypothetical protein